MRTIATAGSVIGVLTLLSHFIHELEWIAHLQPWILLLLCLLAIVSFWNKWWFHAPVLLGLSIYHLHFCWPMLGRLPFLPDTSAETTKHALRVVQFNINADNPRFDDIAQVITYANPDILVLCEANLHVLDRLSHLHHTYPYRMAVARWPGHDLRNVSGTVLWSRHPFLESTPIELSDARIMLCHAVLSVGDNPISVYALHLLAPRSTKQISKRNAGFDELASLLRSDAHPNTLVIGDLNHTVWAQPTRQLLQSTGLRAVMERRIFLSTWPAATYPMGIAIDHILYRGKLRCKDAFTLDGAGSDHRMLVAEIELF